MLHNVVARYLSKQAVYLPPAVAQTVSNLSRKYRDVGLRVEVAEHLFSDGPDYILLFSGNTFPFLNVFKKFRMRWEPPKKAWWVPFKGWRAIEAQFDRALDEVKQQQQPQPQQQPQYPWAKGKVWLQNTEMEDEAEDSGYLFTPADAKSVWGKPTFLADEYSVPPKRMSNEEAMKLWQRLTARGVYAPVQPRSWSGIL